MNFKLGNRAIVLLTSMSLVPGQLMAQDIDTLESQYHKISHEHRHATAEHFLLKMLDASPTPSWKAASLNRLGLECRNQGRYDDAEKYYLAAYKENIAVDHVNRGWIPSNLAYLYLEQDKFDEAERWGNLARSNWEAGGRAHSTQMASTLSILGRLQYAKKQLALAAQHHLASLTMRQALLGAENKEVSYCLSNLGRVLAEQGKLDEGEAMLNKALAMQEKLLAKDDSDKFWTKSHVAFVHRQRGEFAKAEQIDREVLETLEKVITARDRRLGQAYENLSKDLEKLDKADESKAMLAKADEANTKRKELVKGRATKEVTFEVEVASQQADIKAGTTVLLKAKKGDRFRADHVDGQWYAVAVVTGEERKLGYLNYRDIVISNEAAIVEEIRWQQLSPPVGRFTVSLPGSAKLTKQVVNGVENSAYEVTADGTLFMVSFFDIPSGFALTFDSAMSAYTTARKAQLISQKAIDKDLYPGREFTAKLPSGDVSRMQLIQAGRRWFTLTAEGKSETVYGENAKKFFESLQIQE